MPEKPIGLKEALRHYNGHNDPYRKIIEDKKDQLRQSINKRIRSGFLDFGITEKGFYWKESLTLTPARLNDIVMEELAAEYLPLHIVLKRGTETEKDPWGNPRTVETIHVNAVLDKLDEVKRELANELEEEKKREIEEAKIKAQENAKKQEENKARAAKEAEERRIREALEKKEEEQRAKEREKERIAKTEAHTPDDITRQLFNLEAAKNNMSIVWYPDDRLCGYLFFGEVDSDTIKDPKWSDRLKTTFSTLDLVDFTKIIKDFKYKVSLFSWLYTILFLRAYFEAIKRSAYLGLQALRVKNPIEDFKALNDDVEKKIDRIIEKEIGVIERPRGSQPEKNWT